MNERMDDDWLRNQLERCQDCSKPLDTDYSLEELKEIHDDYDKLQESDLMCKSCWEMYQDNPSD